MAQIKKLQIDDETLYPVTIPQAVVDPDSNKTTREELDEKVDKVTGKQLSTEDYTTAEKSKVTNLPLNTTSELALKFDKANLESARSQSTTKAPTSKLLDDELNRSSSALFSINGMVGNDGSFSTSSTYRRTNYLPVAVGTELSGWDGANLTLTQRLCSFFDKDKVFISALVFAERKVNQVTLTTSNTPANAEYFIASTLFSSLSESYVRYANSEGLQKYVSKNDPEISFLKSDKASKTEIVGWLNNRNTKYPFVGGSQEVNLTKYDGVSRDNFHGQVLLDMRVYGPSGIKNKKFRVYRISNKYLGAENWHIEIYQYNLDGSGGAQIYNNTDVVVDNTKINELWLTSGDYTFYLALDARKLNVGARVFPHVTDFVDDYLTAINVFPQDNGGVFKNKKIVCFGDSVTELGNYPEQIAAITGASVYKIGFGGCRMGKRPGLEAWNVAYDKFSMYKVAEQVASGDFTQMIDANIYTAATYGDDNSIQITTLQNLDFSDVDLVTIFYGTNDFTSDENPIGLDASVNPIDLKGAINLIIDQLLTAYPNLRIAFITPTHRFFGALEDQDSDIVANGLGLFLKEYCNAIEEQANLHHLPCLNLYKEGGLNKYNHVYYFGTDGVHPIQVGYDYLANRISAYLQSLYKF